MKKNKNQVEIEQLLAEYDRQACDEGKHTYSENLHNDDSSCCCDCCSGCCEIFTCCSGA